MRRCPISRTASCFVASFANSYAYTLGEQIKDGNGNMQRCTTAGTSQSSGTPTWSTTLGGTTTTGTAVFTMDGAAANYLLTAEAPPDADFSYVSDANVGDIDRYSYAGLPGVPTNIVGVGTLLYSRKDDAGTRSLRVSVNSGGTISDNGTDLVQNSTCAYFEAWFPNDPNTGTAWTASGVNAAKFGPKVTA